MVEYFVIIAMILAAGYWVIRPLLRPVSVDRMQTPKTDDALWQLELQKEGAYATIQELEFDLKMGKLSSEDYEALKRQYKYEAIDCIKAIDDLKNAKKETANMTEADLEEEIEQEISAMRTRGSTDNPHIFCTQCGSQSSLQDRFCFSCGAKLTHGKLRLSHG
jgi:hypothetical protein